MLRTLAVFSVLALGLTPVLAQEIAPAAPAAPAPAPADIEINPTEPLAVSSARTDMMTGFYATLAVIDICAVAVAPDVMAGMATDRARLETAVGLDAAAAAEAYAEVRTDVEQTAPDCAAGSADLASVEAVTAIYAQAAAAQAAAPSVPSAAEGTLNTTPVPPAQ